MKAIFLSASVPRKGRGHYYETADPFLIQCAVREFVIAAIKTYKIVWGGHPAITPMIWAICEDLGIDYSQSVILYQSKYFEDRYPEENEHFKNVIFTEAGNDEGESLLIMRKEMLSRSDLISAVFIGGMEGIEAEFVLFTQFHPHVEVLILPAAGGAALDLAKRTGVEGCALIDIDFAQQIVSHLGRIAE